MTNSLFNLQGAISRFKTGDSGLRDLVIAIENLRCEAPGFGQSDELFNVLVAIEEVNAISSEDKRNSSKEERLLVLGEIAKLEGILTEAYRHKDTRCD